MKPFRHCFTIMYLMMHSDETEFSAREIHEAQEQAQQFFKNLHNQKKLKEVERYQYLSAKLALIPKLDKSLYETATSLTMAIKTDNPVITGRKITRKVALVPRKGNQKPIASGEKNLKHYSLTEHGKSLVNQAIKNSVLLTGEDVKDFAERYKAKLKPVYQLMAQAPTHAKTLKIKP